MAQPVLVIHVTSLEDACVAVGRTEHQAVASSGAVCGDGVPPVPWAALPPDLLARVLLLLPPDARAAAAATCSAWRHARDTSAAVWRSLDLGACAPGPKARLTDARLTALLAAAASRAGSRGISVLDVSDCAGLTAGGVVAATCGLRSLGTLRALGAAPLLTAAHVLQLANQCLSLKDAALGCECRSTEAAAMVLAQSRRGVAVHRLELVGLPDLSDDDAALLADAAHVDGTRLAALSLAGCRLGDDGITTLIGRLRGHPSLTALNLEGCSLGPEGATAVAAAIQHDALPLRSLHLGKNRLFADGARSLAAALQRNSSLTSLSLGSCAIGAAGAKHLATALHHNCTLQWLDVNNNGIGDVGAAALADALAYGVAAPPRLRPGGAGGARQPGALRTLRLRRNSISDAGCASLAKALACDPPLCELDLRLNAAGPGGADALVASLRCNSHCSLLLSGNPAISRDAAFKLQRSSPGRVLAAEQWMGVETAFGDEEGGVDSFDAAARHAQPGAGPPTMWWADAPSSAMGATFMVGEAIAVAIPAYAGPAALLGQHVDGGGEAHAAIRPTRHALLRRAAVAMRARVQRVRHVWVLLAVALLAAVILIVFLVRKGA